MRMLVSTGLDDRDIAKLTDQHDRLVRYWLPDQKHQIVERRATVSG